MIGYFYVILLANIIWSSSAQCPITIKAPCSCSSTRYEPVSIHCDKADSLESVLRALANPPQYIDSLIISNTPIDSVPEGIFAGLTIRRLILQNNGLREIQKGAFTGKLSDSIEQLEIRTNELEKIPEDGITELRNLESLVISDCQIINVPDYTFLHYHSRNRLKKLDLSDNKISTLPAQSLLGLDNLETLILDKNLFTSVPTEALKNVVTLEDLSMSVNKISQILPGALPLPNLKSLSLEVNQIESMKAEVLQQASGLLYLYLSNNRFSVIDPKMFYYVSQLKVLAMSHNVAIKIIPFNAFQYTPSLIRLEMTDCSIGTIEQGTFHNTPKIQVIALAQNKLKRIGVSMFNTLPYVQSIDLKQNEITLVDDYAFSRLKMLQKLDLSSNQLQSLPVNTFFETFGQGSFSVLKVLYLYDNPWHCDHQILWLTTWLRQSLDLQITAPGNAPARCIQPSELMGIDLRNADSMIQAITITTKKPVKPGSPMRAINAGNIDDWNNFKSTLQPIDRETAPVVVTPWTTTVIIIIGIIVLLFALALSIILLVNHCAKRQSRKMRSQSSSDRGDFGIDSSTASGFASLYGSSGMLTCDARRIYAGGLPRQPYDAELGLIKWLILNRTSIPHLPSNYFNGLYIRRLDLVQNGMQSLDAEAFAGLGSTLQELHIQKNNLTRIPVSALSKLNSLLRLDLSENNFHSLEELDALPPLTKLYDINLARNKINGVHKTFFDANKNNLQTINVGHNQIKTVPASALRGFRKLIALHLHNNRITELPKLSFMNLPVLNLLNLASNKIETIDKQAFLNVPKLKYLYLTDNRLKTILPYQFNIFEELDMIDLSNNQITNLPPNAFSGLASIKQIYLTENHIETIADRAFANSSLTILILENNKIQEVTPNMFDGMFALQKLSLKENQIKVVDPNAFRNTTSLTMLDLSKNQLIDLAPSTFLSQLNLLMVDLSENRLIRTPYGAFSRHVSTVILKENPLVCNERIHMLQQGLGVYIPNSEDKICAGQKSIAETIASESPAGSVFKTENVEDGDFLKQLTQINPMQLGANTVPIPVATNSMPKVNSPINIQSIPQNGGSSIIRPINSSPVNVPEQLNGQIPTESEKETTKPEMNSTISGEKKNIPYPNDPDHPDNHPERYYPLPVPFLHPPTKMHPAYTITQTLPPTIVIADDSTEKARVDFEETRTPKVKNEKFEEPSKPSFFTNEANEGEKKAYELDDQQTASKAKQQMPMTLIIICLSTVAIVMIAVFVGLCVARQRSGHFIGSSSSSTTARSNAQFVAQMNQMYGTLPHQR
uniref:Uncharacterized protein n=1 Tax=Panagrolaimus sp. JU765 TaxID=591449 RepID=A0AC34RQ71_9BILA